jgi:hypothetical protein
VVFIVYLWILKTAPYLSQSRSLDKPKQASAGTPDTSYTFMMNSAMIFMKKILAGSCFPNIR